MRFALWPNTAQPWGGVVETARYADEHGWDGVYVADHFMPDGVLRPETEPMHECWGALGALAALTERVRLGTLVCGNTYRHPAVLLKQAVTVDHASGGRVVLGIGAGWQENEHRQYGIPFFTTAERLSRLDEACSVIRALVDGDGRVSFSGDHYRLEEASLAPKAEGPLPLLVGGGGERVTLRIAALHADEWNVWGTPETLRHKIGVLEGHCEEVGRDPAQIRRSANAVVFMSEDAAFLDRIRSTDFGGLATMVGTPEEVLDVVRDYEAAGVDELIVPDWNMGDLDRRRRILDAFTEKILEPCRDGA